MAALAGSGCAAPYPEPRCVAERMFADEELAFSVAPFGPRSPHVPRLVQVLYRVDGHWTPLPTRIADRRIDCRPGQRVTFVAPSGARRVEVYAVVDLDGRRFQLHVPYVRRDLPGGWKWLRRDERVSLHRRLR